MSKECACSSSCTPKCGEKCCPDTSLSLIVKNCDISVPVAQMDITQRRFTQYFPGTFALPTPVTNNPTDLYDTGVVMIYPFAFLLANDSSNADSGENVLTGPPLRGPNWPNAWNNDVFSAVTGYSPLPNSNPYNGTTEFGSGYTGTFYPPFPFPKSTVLQQYYDGTTFQPSQVTIPPPIEVNSSNLKDYRYCLFTPKSSGKYNVCISHSFTPCIPGSTQITTTFGFVDLNKRPVAVSNLFSVATAQYPSGVPLNESQRYSLQPNEVITIGTVSNKTGFKLCNQLCLQKNHTYILVGMAPLWFDNATVISGTAPIPISNFLVAGPANNDNPWIFNNYDCSIYNNIEIHISNVSC
jgi:hypothetical protein